MKSDEHLIITVITSGEHLGCNLDMSYMFPQYTHWKHGRNIFGTTVATILNVIDDYKLDTC